MTIRIFESITDSFMKIEWERLELEGDVFPQSRYHWCSTWWKHMSGPRKLHIVMNLDDNGRAMAIAPLCIERHFGCNVLRSFPIHFGDYYTFITSLDPEKAKAAINRILQYIDHSKYWVWVRLEQVVETDILAQSLHEHEYQEKRITGSVISNFNNLSWEGYLAKLHRRFRQNIRSRQRKIDKTFRATLKTIRSWEVYVNEYNNMLEMHEKRWCDDNVPHKNSDEITCWREAIKGQYAAGKMIYYQLFFNGEQVAYRLGFIHHNTYYAWHTGFNPSYRDYYPGIMITAYMIRDFIKQGITTVNFMAGEYDWKLEWSPDRTVVSHYMFSSPSTKICATLLNLYHHRFRDSMKALYHAMMKNRYLRVLSRQVISLQQRLAGKR